MKTYKIGAILLIIFMIFLSYIFLGSPSIISRINTEYTKNYNLEKLSSIKNGTTEQQVIAILGEPLDKYTDDSFHFLYSKPRNTLSDITGWESVRITFDKNHHVIGIGSDIFFN